MMCQVFMSILSAMFLVDNVTASSVAETALVNTLLSSYNRLVKAYDQDDGLLTVTVKLRIIRIVSLENNVLEMYSVLETNWRDLRLVWNPKMYNGLEKIHLPIEELWYPDLLLYNKAGKDNFGVRERILAVISFDGNVIFDPPLFLRSTCPVGPNDVEVTCKLKMGSWTYGANEIDLRVNENVNLLEFVELHDVWTVRNATAERNEKSYDCCPNDTFFDVTFTINVGKKNHIREQR